MVLKCFWSVLKVRLRLDLLLLSSSGALFHKLMLITRVRCHSCHWHTKITSENSRPMFSKLFSIPLPNHIRKIPSYVFQALLYTSTKSHQKTPVLCFPGSSLYLYQIKSEKPRPMFFKLFSIPLPRHISQPKSAIHISEITFL